MFDFQKPKQPSEDAIIVQNVSKHFCIPHEKKTRLFEHIAGALKGTTSTYEEFWALKDVSFTVKKGETLGIIGENGSGKSTLLKIIAGVLTPDSGSVKVNGKIAPLPGTWRGFQPGTHSRGQCAALRSYYGDV
jgi:lipopolysaccharide transport system ATP-binding protein